MKRLKKVMGTVIALAMLVTSIPINYTITAMAEDTNDESNVEVKNPRVKYMSRQFVNFGHYWQNDTNKDGVVDKNDKKSPISWQILDIGTNGNAILLADKVLDIQKFTEDGTGDESWVGSNIKKWLDSDFINDAFTSDEQSKIEYQDSHVGEKVDAKVYLPSTGALGYGELEQSEYESGNLATERAKASDYVKSREQIEKTSVTNDQGFARYQLMSRWDYVDYDGNVKGKSENGNYYGIRPIIKIDINTSDLQIYTRVIGICNVEYDTITFGNYDADYAWNDDDTLTWRVLSVNDGKALLYADKPVSARDYDSGLAYRTSFFQTSATKTWRNSELRKWMNQDFYESAFNEDEKKAIIETGIKTYDGIDTNGSDPDITNDKVFLLSYDEIMNPLFGFEPYPDYTDDKRQGFLGNYATYAYPPNNQWLRTTGWVSGGHGLIYKRSKDSTACCGVMACIKIDLSKMPKNTMVKSKTVGITDPQWHASSIIITSDRNGYGDAVLDKIGDSIWNTPLNSEDLENQRFFKIGEDTNNFNHTDMTLKLSGEDAESLVDNIKANKDNMTWYDKIANFLQIIRLKNNGIGDSGVCHGIATTMCYTNQGVLNLDYIKHGAKNYWQFGDMNDNTRLANIIVYYQLLQTTDLFKSTHAVNKAWNAFFDNYSLSDFLKDFVNEARRCQNEKKPFIFSFTPEKEEGHSVVVCGYKWNNTDNCHEIIIYDENSHRKLTDKVTGEYLNTNGYYIVMSVNEDYSSFDFIDANDINDRYRSKEITLDNYNNVKTVYSKWFSDPKLQSDWVSLSYCGIDNLYNHVNAVKGSEYWKHSEKNSMKMTSLKQAKNVVYLPSNNNYTTLDISAFKKFRITNSDGKTLICDGNSITGDMNVVGCELKGENDQFWRVSVEASDSFIITGYDDTINCSLNVGGKNYAVVTSPNSNNTIELSSNGIKYDSSNGKGPTYKIDAYIGSTKYDAVHIECNAKDKTFIDTSMENPSITSESNVSDIHASYIQDFTSNNLTKKNIDDDDKITYEILVSDNEGGNTPGGSSGNGSGNTPGGTSGNGSGNTPGGTSGNGSGNTPSGTSGNGSGNTPGGTSGNGSGNTPGGTSGNGSGNTSGGSSGNGSGNTPGGTSGNGSGNTSGGTSDNTITTNEYTQKIIGNINKAKGKVIKVVSKKKKIIVKVKKVKIADIKEIKYQYAIRMKGTKSWKKFNLAKTSKIISGLKSNRKYQVRVRPYTKINGTTYYGKWSKVFTKRVK